MTAERTILHVDLDAFYASVEQRDDPSLRGRPVIVGGDRRRGVVCAASYEVRRFGVRSAMPMAQAVRLCPHAVVLRPRMGQYAAVSREFFAVLRRYTPLVEGLSLDEAFLDTTASARLFGDGPAIAVHLRAAVRKELRLTASVGVAPTKFLAKIASDLAKPDGVRVVDPGDVRAFLEPLPVSRLWGVGKVTEQSLARLGLATIGDVARADPDRLRATLGKAAAEHLFALARGIDPREVEPGRAPVSIGHEDTFDRDHFDRRALWPEILDQADRVAARLRADGLHARCVTLKVKYADHHRVSRRLTLPAPTCDSSRIAEAARALLDAVPAIESRGVRLTGVSVSGLGHERRQLLIDEPAIERGERLGATLDRIHARFGDDAVRRAVHVNSAREDGE